MVLKENKEEVRLFLLGPTSVHPASCSRPRAGLRGAREEEAARERKAISLCFLTQTYHRRFPWEHQKSLVGGRGYGQQDLLTKGLFSRIKQFGQEVQEKEGGFKKRKKKLVQKRKSIIFQLR